VYVQDKQQKCVVTVGETIVAYLRLNEQRRPELELEGLRPKFSRVRAKEVAVKPWSLYHFEVEAAGDVGQREFGWFRLVINTVEGAPHRYEMGLTVELPNKNRRYFFNHYTVKEAVVVEEEKEEEEGGGEGAHTSRCDG
jgi:hypothetical protein